MKRFLSILLVLTFLLSPTGLAGGLYVTYFETYKPITDSLSYTQYIGENSSGKKERVYILDYKHGSDTFPAVVYGDTLFSRKTLTSMLKVYPDAVAGVNGDFFSFYTGVPMGLVISEGKLVTSDAGTVALGIYPDGTTVVGKPNIKNTLSFTYEVPIIEEVIEVIPPEEAPTEEVAREDSLTETLPDAEQEALPEETLTDAQTPIPDLPVAEVPETVLAEHNAHFNKYPTIWSVYITDSRYSKTTKSDFPCREIVVKYDGKITLGTSVLLTVEAVFSDTQNNEIPEGRMVITVPDSHKSAADFAHLKVGDTISLSITSDEAWQGVETAISGGDIIVENSEFIPETVNEDHEKYRNARTAVGIRENGTLFFVCVDYTKDSAGMSIEELAEFMIGEGALTALNLDGGGSATVAVSFPDSENARIVNVPSENNTERRISNAILFMNRAEEISIPSFVDFKLDKFVLAGTDYVLNPTFYSPGQNEINAVFDTAEYLVSQEGAKVENGVYTAADLTYTERLFAKYTFGGQELETNSVINVTDTLDEFSLNKSGILVTAGDTHNLSLSLSRYGIEVLAPFDYFNYTLNGKSFENTENTDTVESGNIIETEALVLDRNGLLTIGDAPLFTSLELVASYKDMSDTLKIYFGKENTILEAFDSDTLLNVTSPDKKSITQGYRTESAVTASDGNVFYTQPIALDLVPEYFTISLKGSYDSTLYAVLQDSDGNNHLFPYYLHKNYSSISGWSELIAPVTENLDGEVLLVAPVASSEEKLITVDSFISHYGYDTDPFSDIGGIWSHDYITEVYDMGLVNGYSENGELIFKPENFITRAEFSKMLVSYLGFDTKLYSGYGSDFSDGEAIPEWAKEYVRAVSTEGYMNGRLNSDGTLTFDAQSYITRAEAMTVFSKLIEALPEETLLEFTDEQTIPEWAREAVLKTVSAGIVTGFDDGTVRVSDNVTRAQMCVMFTRLWKHKNSF